MAGLNLYALEDVLIKALRDKLPPEVKVGSALNLVGRQDLGAMCPGAFVLPGDQAPLDADTDPDPDAVTVQDEQWSVITLTSAIRDTTDADADFAEAGTLLGHVYQALQGARVPGYRTLVYTGTQPPNATAQGLCEATIDFTTVRAFAASN